MHMYAIVLVHCCAQGSHWKQTALCIWRGYPERYKSIKVLCLLCQANRDGCCFAIKWPYTEAPSWGDISIRLYKAFHSTETALVRVHNDILTAIDNNSVLGPWPSFIPTIYLSSCWQCQALHATFFLVSFNPVILSHVHCKAKLWWRKHFVWIRTERGSSSNAFYRPPGGLWDIVIALERSA